MVLCSSRARDSTIEIASRQQVVLFRCARYFWDFVLAIASVSRYWPVHECVSICITYIEYVRLQLLDQCTQTFRMERKRSVYCVHVRCKYAGIFAIPTNDFILSITQVNL